MPLKSKKPQRNPKRKSRTKTAPGARASAAKSRAIETTDKALRQHLLYLLSGGGAHVSFEEAIANFPRELRGARPQDLTFTAWRLLEHMRIAQGDILEFSRSSKHVSPPWPEGYWPEGDAPPEEGAWEKSLRAFRRDLKTMQTLVSDPAADLFARIPHGSGQTLLREALLVADHNAYHLGQIVLLRRLLGAWSEK